MNRCEVIGCKGRRPFWSMFCKTHRHNPKATVKGHEDHEGCVVCGSMAVGEDGLCWKCNEYETRMQEKTKA